MSNWIFIEKERYGGKGGSRYSQYFDKPVAVTTPNGEILLTPCAMEMLGYPRYIALMSDPARRLLAILTSSESESHVARKVQYVRSGKSTKNLSTNKPQQMARISAPGFIRSNGMVADNSCFVWTLTPQDDMLVIDLKQRREVISYVRRHRNGKR